MTYQPPKHGMRTFFIIWITQSLSVFGSSLTGFALNIWLTQVLYPSIEQKKELAFAISALATARGLTMLLIGPVAGAWADRHDRKRTMMLANVLNGLLHLLLVGLVTTGSLQVWMLVVLSVIFSLCDAFHFASFDTSHAMLVPESFLSRANGMMQTMWALTGILSPGIAAAVITLPELARQGAMGGWLGDWLQRMANGAPLAITVDAATFLIAGVTLLFVSVPSPRRKDMEHGKPRKSIWADIREGANYIWLRRPMLWLLGTFTVCNLILNPGQVFMPLILKFNLAESWTALGYTYEGALARITTISSIGGLLGGLAISLWGGLKHRRVLGVLIPIAVSGITHALFGWSTQLYLSAVVMAVGAAMFPMMNSHSQAIWQAQTPRELQGRVFSVRRVIAQCTGPLSMALAGWVGGIFDPGQVMLVTGLFLTAFCLLQLFNPVLMRVEDKKWLDAMAANQ